MEFERKLLAQKLEYQRLIAEAQPETAASKTTICEATKTRDYAVQWLLPWLAPILGSIFCQNRWGRNSRCYEVFLYLKALVEPKIRTCFDITVYRVSIQDHPYRINFGVSWSEEDFILLPLLGICRRPFCKSESGRMIEMHCDSTGDPENKLNSRRSDSHELYSGLHLRRSC